VRRPTVLLVADYYLPGYSIGNLVASLRDEFELRVLTRNHDVGDPRPYDGIESDRWLARDGHQVRYLSQTRNRPAAIARAIAEAKPDLVCLNSFFSQLTISAVQRLIDLDDAGYARLSASTLAFAADHARRTTAIEDSRRMLHGVLTGTAP
jgi:hypothetical protein